MYRRENKGGLCEILYLGLYKSKGGGNHMFEEIVQKVIQVAILESIAQWDKWLNNKVSAYCQYHSVINSTIVFFSAFSVDYLLGEGNLTFYLFVFQLLFYEKH